MNFDRNTVIGFVVLGLLFFGYFMYSSKEQQAIMKERARQDSIANARQPKVDSNVLNSVKTDSPNLVQAGGDNGYAQTGTEQITTIENEVFTIAFTNKGGQIKWVELKKFKGPDNKNVRLASTDFDKINYAIKTPAGKPADIANFYFTGGQKSTPTDSSQSIVYQLTGSNGTSVTHEFVVRKDNYMVDFNLKMDGVSQLADNNSLNILWQNRALQLQKDVHYERQMSQIAYRVNDAYDHSSAMKTNNENFEKPVNWIAVQQQFFNSTFIAKNNFSSGHVDWIAYNKDNKIVEAVVSLKLPLPATQNTTIPLAFYFGPTDYKILKQAGYEMKNMVNLGSGMWAFVKYLNRWIVIPLFDFLHKLASNYGIVILLLTLCIRLLISPLTYSSYLSGAKMRVLRPEIDKLKAKFGDDQQQMSMEQMKLFREAGVNPMGGCIPGLLQIPIFFALYSFFNSNVALRGESFLWSHDLSQYDSILNLPFPIPFYGDHVSLFTLTATATSFIISIYSMSMTPDQSNPVLKWMPYIFPFFMLFFFNKLPSGLTWYYTVSNVITLALQFTIQNYIIDHDKILAKIEATRKKPKTKSKWQQSLEAMQTQQKKVQEMQQKTKK